MAWIAEIRDGNLNTGNVIVGTGAFNAQQFILPSAKVTDHYYMSPSSNVEISPGVFSAFADQSGNGNHPTSGGATSTAFRGQKYSGADIRSTNENVFFDKDSGSNIPDLMYEECQVDILWMSTESLLPGVPFLAHGDATSENWALWLDEGKLKIRYNGGITEDTGRVIPKLTGPIFMSLEIQAVNSDTQHRLRLWINKELMYTSPDFNKPIFGSSPSLSFKPGALSGANGYVSFFRMTPRQLDGEQASWHSDSIIVTESS